MRKRGNIYSSWSNGVELGEKGQPTRSYRVDWLRLSHHSNHALTLEQLRDSGDDSAVWELGWGHFGPDLLPTLNASPPVRLLQKGRII